MAEPRRADIEVAPLSRALLDGVDDGSGGPRRRVDLAVLPCFEDERPLQGLAGLVDWRTSGSLSMLLRSGFCTGAAGEAVLLPGGRELPMERIVLLGLGPSGEFARAEAEATGERLVALVDGLAPRDVLVAMPGRAPERAVVEAVFDGLTRALALRYRPAERDAQAQVAARAVGDESSGPGPVDPRTPPSLAQDGPVSPRPVLAAANPAKDPRAPLEAVADVVALEGSVRDSAPEALVEPGVCHWWVVADPRHEARLRRLLEGPPRAAEPGA